MKRNIFAGYLLTATEAYAEPPVSTGFPVADSFIEAALTEHRIFLTCSSLEKNGHILIAKLWQETVRQSLEIFQEKGVSVLAIESFKDESAIDNLMPADDAPFSEVRALCDASADWAANYYRLNFTVLELKLPKAFEK